MAVADVVTGGVQEEDCKSIRTIAPLQFFSPYNTYKNNIIIPIRTSSFIVINSSSSTRGKAPADNNNEIIPGVGVEEAVAALYKLPI